MNRIVLAGMLCAGLYTASAPAQDRATDLTSGYFAVRELDLAAGYTAIYANAPPLGGCGCFWMNGGHGEVAIMGAKRLGLVGNFGMTTATNIGANSGHDLTLATYLAGPRYSLKEHHRLTPYAQLLLGGAHSSSNNALDSAKTSFALATGGGADFRINQRFSWRTVEVDYLFTQIPNGVNDRQNQLRISSGIVLHLK